MKFPLSPQEIQTALEPYGPPLANVAANWPQIEAALDAREIYSELTAVAAIATVRVESPNFIPMVERGGPSYFADLYDGRKDLGNMCVGDGARFRGRGFIQITGRWDYTHFGAEIGKDLVNNPGLALDPAVSAEILAAFFKERRVPEFANNRRWNLVRGAVNGGMNQFQLFMSCVNKLVAQLAEHGEMQATK